MRLRTTPPTTHPQSPLKMPTTSPPTSIPSLSTTASSSPTMRTPSMLKRSSTLSSSHASSAHHNHLFLSSERKLQSRLSSQSSLVRVSDKLQRSPLPRAEVSVAERSLSPRLSTSLSSTRDLGESGTARSERRLWPPLVSPESRSTSGSLTDSSKRKASL